ncbi:MAG: T9SS type A sorting domain-containing protein [Bacteroidetes bacterium]|nr:T9SS type A sorting domain-containing protein [Bacteroidota bacterium]
MIPNVTNKKFKWVVGDACSFLYYWKAKHQQWRSLYPNPGSDMTFLKFNEATYCTIQISNVSGSYIGKVYSGMISTSSTIPIETKHLHSGIYFISVTTPTETKCLRFVKL